MVAAPTAILLVGTNSPGFSCPASLYRPSSVRAAPCQLPQGEAFGGTYTPKGKPKKPSPWGRCRPQAANEGRYRLTGKETPGEFVPTKHITVGAATSCPKRSETEQLVERIPPDGSLKSLLLLEKVPAAAGECGGDTCNECRSRLENIAKTRNF